MEAIDPNALDSCCAIHDPPPLLHTLARSLQRLNVLSFKLQRARSYLSLHSFRLAQYYLLSTWHDLRAMRRILIEAGRKLSSNLVCDVVS